MPDTVKPRVLHYVRGLLFSMGPITIYSMHEALSVLTSHIDVRENQATDPRIVLFLMEWASAKSLSAEHYACFEMACENVTAQDTEADSHNLGIASSERYLFDWLVVLSRFREFLYGYGDEIATSGKDFLGQRSRLNIPETSTGLAAQRQRYV